MLDFKFSTISTSFSFQHKICYFIDSLTRFSNKFRFSIKNILNRSFHSKALYFKKLPKLSFKIPSKNEKYKGA